MTDANIHINILGNAFTQVNKLSTSFQKFEKIKRRGACGVQEFWAGSGTSQRDV